MQGESRTKQVCFHRVTPQSDQMKAPQLPENPGEMTSMKQHVGH